LKKVNALFNPTFNSMNSKSLNLLSSQLLRIFPHAIKGPSALLTIFLCLACSASAQSPNVSVFATGLKFPRGLKFGPDGNLYVAEAGAGGTTSTTSGQCAQVVPPVGPYKGGLTARISKISPTGTRTTVADNLPSTIAAIGDVEGVADVAFIGNTLYALIAGAGCSHGHATTDNAVVRVNANGTTTAIADLSAFQMANPVANPEPDDFEPDGTWYSLLRVGSAFVAIEPNHGEIDMVTTAGVITRIADISATQGHIVPTVVAYDGDFYVGNLNTFPIVNGSSKILKITSTGQVTTFATGLTSVLGLAFDSLHRLYVLETSTKNNDFPTPGTGKIVRITQSGGIEEIATGLSLATGMTFGPDGNLYVSNWGYGPPNMGEILKITLQKAQSQVANISARGFVQTGDKVLIGGFILGANTTATKVIVRAIGPSLAQSHVSNVLADPTLDLRDHNGTRIAFDDNWRDNAAQAALITATGIPPRNNLESAIVANLAPGSYTAIVAGKNGGTGVALVEVYTLN
jgi:hypothetical protein